MNLDDALVRIKELEEYITDLEEENENLSEYNRLLVLRIQEKDTNDI